MEIRFATSELKMLCENKKQMKKELGEICARKLMTRLEDLASSSNVTELTAGRPHPLVRERKGQYSVDLYGGKRLVFEPANQPIPRDKDEAIDWRRVTIVRIVFIGDYHD